jgi:hypothetical protein
VVILENSADKYYNKNSLLWDKKTFPIIKTGYVMGFIACIAGDVLYYYHFHDNDKVLLYLPLFPVFLYMIFYILKALIIRPNGDKEYLLKYYPDLMKKLLWPEPNHIRKFSDIEKVLAWKYFLDGSYTEGIDDEIIDRMRVRFKKDRNLYWYPFIFFIVFSILMGMCTELR